MGISTGNTLTRTVWNAGNLEFYNGSDQELKLYNDSTESVITDATQSALTDATDLPVKYSGETVLFSAFTDGGGTTGTIDLTGTVPVKATFLFAAITACVGFAGDTTATVQIGDGTDADRYTTGTPDVFTTAAGGIAVGSPSGVLYHDVAKTVTVTVTGAADFTSISAGSLTIRIYYLEGA